MSAAPTPLRLRWSSMLLVCRECQRRKRGPKNLKAKAVVAALRDAAKADGTRARVARTDCLGLCPHRAITVVRAAPGGLRAVAVGSEREAASAASSLAGVAPETR